VQAKLVAQCWQPELKIRELPENLQARRLRAARLN
jgi:hypothetical protein